MNKLLKTAGFALLLAGSVTLLGGCGDSKPASSGSKSVAASSSKQEAKQDKKDQKAAEKPVPTSKLYRFGVHIKDKNQIPTITPEVTAEFEKAAANFDIPAKDTKHQIEGLWVYKASPISKNAQIFSHWWTLELEGHHATKFEYEDKGKVKKGQEQHIGHVEITVDVKTNKIKEVRVYRFDLTEDNPKGTKTEISKQKF